MNTVQVAFYKGTSVFDNIIKFWTKSKYSHVELIIDGIWVTSSPGEGGVVKRYPSTIPDFNINDYDIYTLDCKYYNEDILHKYIYLQLNCKYDWKGIIFSQFFTLGYNESNKWFCSELVTKLLQILLIEDILDLQPNKVSPGKLYNCLKYTFR